MLCFPYCTLSKKHFYFTRLEVAHRAAAIRVIAERSKTDQQINLSNSPQWMCVAERFITSCEREGEKK